MEDIKKCAFIEEDGPYVAVEGATCVFNKKFVFLHPNSASCLLENYSGECLDDQNIDFQFDML